MFRRTRRRFLHIWVTLIAVFTLGLAVQLPGIAQRHSRSSHHSYSHRQKTVHVRSHMRRTHSGKRTSVRSHWRSAPRR